MEDRDSVDFGYDLIAFQVISPHPGQRVPVSPVITISRPWMVEVMALFHPEDFSHNFCIYLLCELLFQRDCPQRYKNSCHLAVSGEVKIIEAHTGRIWVESKMRDASRFTFILPLNEINEVYINRL